MSDSIPVVDYVRIILEKMVYQVALGLHGRIQARKNLDFS